jgi:hypothetical protein
MNKLDFYPENDPREKALGDAVDRAIAQRARVSLVRGFNLLDRKGPLSAAGTAVMCGYGR